MTGFDDGDRGAPAAADERVDTLGDDLPDAVVAAVANGVVGVRELSMYTTQVLRAVEVYGSGVLVTRHGKVVAELTPTTMHAVLDRARGSTARSSGIKAGDARGYRDKAIGRESDDG